MFTASIFSLVEYEPVRQTDCVKIRAKTFPGAPCEEYFCGILAAAYSIWRIPSIVPNAAFNTEQNLVEFPNSS